MTFTGETAVVVARALRAEVDRAERTHGTVPDGLRKAFEAASVAAQGYLAERNSATSGFGSAVGTCDLADGTESVLPVIEVARRLGCSPEYVRRLCRQGRLNARQDSRGTWWIDADAVAA